MFTVTTAGRPAGDPNEDFAVAVDGVAVVIDGAGVPVSGCMHSVPWFARMLAVNTLASLVDPVVSLSSGLAAGISAVADLHSSTCDLSDGMTPCASVGIARVSDGMVEALSLSDVAVCVETADGIDIVCDLSIEALCGTEPGALSGLAFDTPAHNAALSTLVDCQTAYRNKAGGWWVAAADPEAAHHAIVRTYERADVCRLAIMSDGATRPVEQMGMYGWGEYLDLLDKLGPAGLIEHVRGIEVADPDGATYPRTKQHDDASIAVWCAGR